MPFAPPQQWGRRRDRRFTPSSDEAVRDRRFVQCEVGRGPLDLEARRLGARLAARPRWCCLEALEGGPAHQGGRRLRRDDLGVHGLFVLLCSQPATGLPPPVGLPPQRGRGSHECPRARMLGGEAIGRALFALPPSALGAPCNDGWLAAPRPARASTASGPGGRGWPEYWLGSDARSRERRRRHRRDPTAKETGTKLLIAS